MIEVKAPTVLRRLWRRLRNSGALLALILILYHIALHPAITRRALVGAVDRFTNATLEVDVQRSSLLYGFDFHNLRLNLKSGAPLFKAERVRLAWFLPAAFAGHIGVRELLLQRPEVFITSKDGVLNWSQFMPPGETRPETPPAAETKPRRNIALYARLKTYFNLRVEDLRIHYLAEAEGERVEAEISNVDLFMAFVTHETDNIPLHLGAFDLFETFLLALNPQRPIQIELKAARKLRGELKASWYVFRDGRRGAQEFATRLNVDARRLLIGDQSLGLNIYYDIAYDAPGDRLLIRGVEVRNYEDRWLALRAEATNASSPARRLNLEILPTRIPLADVGRTIAALSGAKKAPISGDSVTIDRFSIRGRMDRVALDSALRINDLRFGNGGPLERIESAALDLNAELDLYQALPALEPPENYRPNPALVFGIFHRMVAPELSLQYNKARARGEATMLPESGVKMSLAIENLDLARFAPQAANGFLEARLEASSTQDFRNLGLRGQLRVTQARYFIDRSRSGLHTLGLRVDGALLLRESSTDIRIQELRIDARTPEGAPMALVDASGALSFADNRQLFEIKLRDLDLQYNNIHPALPGQLRYSLQPIKLYLSKGASLNGQARYERRGESSDIRASGRMALPFLKLTDLSFTAALGLSPKSTRIDQLQLDGLKGALAARVRGEIVEREGISRPKLQASLRLAQQELIPVHENIALSGAFALDAEIDADRVRGKLKSDELNVTYRSGDCSRLENSSCTAYFVRGLNADLPFDHSLRFRGAGPTAPATEYFNAYGRSGSPNLRILSVASNRTPNGEIMPGNYFFLGSPSGDAGLSARLDYNNNTLLLGWLRLAAFKKVEPPVEGRSWLPNGLIDGRSIYFRLADLNPSNMAFSANLQIKNLDLQPFLPQTRSTYDGVISADLKATSSNLADALYSTQASVNVFRISREFSGFVTRILMPSQIVSMVVRRTVEIPSIRVELRGGLVYSYIGVVRGGIVGAIISPGGEEIKQERMPLAQFLERARSEVQDFGERGTGGDDA